MTTTPPSQGPCKRDHHVHVQTERASIALVQQKEAGKETVEERDRQVIDGAKVLRLLDEAAIHEAIVISSAYLFASGTTALDPGEEKKEVTRENDWTLQQAAESSGRLLAFGSVNPLRPYAAEEVRRWKSAQIGGVRFRGLKLHLTNSGVDLRSEAHLEKLRNVLEEADRTRLCVLLHLATRYEMLAESLVDVLHEKILPCTEHVPLIVAHLGDGKRPDFASNSLHFLQACKEAFFKDEEPRPPLYFDLSYTIPSDDRQNSGSAAHWRAYWAPQMLRQMEAIGLDRILFGSDWPNVSPEQYLSLLREKLQMDKGAIEQILRNRVPLYD